jgi:hypothetical protein
MAVILAPWQNGNGSPPTMIRRGRRPWSTSYPHSWRSFSRGFIELIDWSRGYESLDKEFQQIIREAALGKVAADKLFKVWRHDGQDAWVLIHVEIQSQPEEDFPERMFIYNIRSYERYRRTIASLALLCDDRKDWRPDHFGYALGGSEMTLRFPVSKLLDYAGRQEELAKSDNPLAQVVQAHLQARATRQDPAARLGSQARPGQGTLRPRLADERCPDAFPVDRLDDDLTERIERRVSRVAPSL